MVGFPTILVTRYLQHIYRYSRVSSCRVSDLFILLSRQRSYNFSFISSATQACFICWVIVSFCLASSLFMLLHLSSTAGPLYVCVVSCNFFLQSKRKVVKFLSFYLFYNAFLYNACVSERFLGYNLFGYALFHPDHLSVISM